MQRAWYAADAFTFAADDPLAVLGALNAASTFPDEPTQKAAWPVEIAHLQPIAAALPSAHIFLEFSLPRMGRRADANIPVGGLNLLSTRLTYDGVGRIAREVTRLPGSDLDRSYTYTVDGELATVTEAGGPTTRYTYDANGNRASIEVNGTVTTASYDDQDRLTQYGTTTYAYDGA